MMTMMMMITIIITTNNGSAFNFVANTLPVSLDVRPEGADESREERFEPVNLSF